MRFFVAVSVLGALVNSSSLAGFSQANSPTKQRRVTPSAKRIAPARTGAPSSQRSEAEKELLVTLAQFIQDKNIPSAREGFLHTLRIDPTYPQPRFNLGVLAEAEDNRPEAIKWFTEYLKFDQTSRYARAARAKLRRFQSANTNNSAGVVDRRHQYDNHLARARLFIKAGLLKEAIAEFDEAARVDDTRWEAYAMTALVLTQQGLLAEAKEFEEKAKQRTPFDKQKALAAVLQSDAQERQYRQYSQNAVKAFRQKNYIKAAEEFSGAWQLFPERSDAAFAAAVAFAAGKDYVEAAIILNRLRMNPNTVVAQKAERMLQSMTLKK